MSALTARLNERDETIIQLQEELDAYDRIHRETESLVEQKTKRCSQLEEFIQERCGGNMPIQTEQEINISGLPDLSSINDKSSYEPHTNNNNDNNNFGNQ